MTAKKSTAKKAGRPRRARAAAVLAAPTCPNCGRELQAHETIEGGKPCQRCQFEATYPGRNLDEDQAAAQALGVRLSTYVRDAIEQDGSVERERRAGLRGH